MHFNYQLNNVVGTIYRKGTINFTPDGDCLLTPVGNRLKYIHLKGGKSECLSIETHYNILNICINHSNTLVLIIAENGDGYFFSLISFALIQKYSFLTVIKDVKFSPDDKYFSIAKDNFVQVFLAPGYSERQFHDLRLLKTYKKAYESITCLDWANNNSFLACGCTDSVIRFFAIKSYLNFGGSLSLSGHSSPIISINFFKNSLNVISCSTNGILCLWHCDTNLEGLKINNEIESYYNKTYEFESDEQNNLEIPNSNQLLQYKRLKKYYFERPSNIGKNNGIFVVTAVNFNKHTSILVTGTNLGFFYIHEMPNFNHIQSVSISDFPIDAIAINTTGEWVACASSRLGQIAVWEWGSQSYILKQQSHFNDTLFVAYSLDGSRLATGCFDGKVKIWDANNGICLVTFNDHSGAITGLRFPKAKNNVLISSSVDGTVRAYDLIRYKNFKSFNTNEEGATQISCIALDPMAEFVFGGSSTTFEIFLWSMKTGKLLEILSGHTSPVSGLEFDAINDKLISCSWDKTIKVWDVFGTKTCKETIQLTAEAMAMTLFPIGSIVAVSTMNGHISLWDIRDSIILASIDSANIDLESGRGQSDTVKSKNTSKNKCFNCLAFSPDGHLLLAGGDSKYACLYGICLSNLTSPTPYNHNPLSNVSTTDAILNNSIELIKKFVVTQNKSFDRMEDDSTLNRRKMTEWGNLDARRYESESTLFDDVEKSCESSAINLPGVKKLGLDSSSRFFKPEIHIDSISFSPSGRSFALATTEGALIYSLDSRNRNSKLSFFDPFELDVNITPDRVSQYLNQGKYKEALMAALRINNKDLIRQTVEDTPDKIIDFTLSSLHQKYVIPLLAFVGTELESSTKFELYLRLAHKILTFHAAVISANSPTDFKASVDQLKFKSLLSLLRKSINEKYSVLKNMCNSNKHFLQYAHSIDNVTDKMELTNVV